MGTRHWPEDADEAVEKLEVEVVRLREALSKGKKHAASLVHEHDLQARRADTAELQKVDRHNKWMREVTKRTKAERDRDEARANMREWRSKASRLASQLEAAQEGE